MSILQLTKHYFSFFLFLFIINLEYIKNNKTYEIKIPIRESELEILNINNKDNIDYCSKWVPSLFTPILLITDPIKDNEETISPMQVDSKIMSMDSTLNLMLYNISYVGNQNKVVAGFEILGGTLKNCYFGLSSRAGNYSTLNESFIFLNRLYNQKIIDEKIFSFDKWDLKNNKTINTNLFLGYSHQDFTLKSEKGKIGECKVPDDYETWGCQFKNISFDADEEIFGLDNEKNIPYKIYFSTENYDIIFPKTFRKKFYNLTKDQCQTYSNKSESEDYYATCTNLNEKTQFFSLKLISDKMNITIEIDSKKRFSNGTTFKPNRTRVKFEEIEYFILPLIMFKNFHIQFNAKERIIKFYTEKPDILEIEKEKKNKKSSSKVGTVFLIIFIIILIMALGYGIFYIIKKRKGSVEKNINKYNKFDEDENFKNMNEQRVF